MQFIGTIESVRVADVSKRAGASILKTYVRLLVEDGTQPAIEPWLGAPTSFIADGELAEAPAVGARVEIESFVGAERGPAEPLPIYRLRALP